MKNHDEMYQSLLSRYNDYQEKKKKRIRTIRRTVPALACFCISVVFIPMIWDDFAKLPSVTISPDIVDDLSKESSTSAYIADATESRLTDQTISTGAVSTTVPPYNTETGRNTATAANQTVTTVVSVDDAGEHEQEATEHRETVLPVTTAAVIQTQPITEIQTTSPVQTTAEPPKTIITKTELNVSQTTTAPHNTSDSDNYSAIILNGICFWNTHEINTAGINEDLILYYYEPPLSNMVDSPTHTIITPEWGTRYYILNENEVAVEINGKWIVFSRSIPTATASQ